MTILLDFYQKSFVSYDWHTFAMSIMHTFALLLQENILKLFPCIFQNKISILSKILIWNEYFHKRGNLSFIYIYIFTLNGKFKEIVMSIL